jgi:hypothetical protein
MNQKTQILRFWRAVEIFNPQSVPKIELNPKKEEKQTNRFTGEDTDAPWQAGYRQLKASGKGYVWRHEVYGGVYFVKRVRELLEAKFGSDPKSYDSRLDALSACFQVSVNQDGRPFFDTFVVSACVWAWGRTISPGPNSPNWLDGFDTFAEDFLVRVRQEFAVPDDDQEGQRLLKDDIDIGRKLTLADIDTVTKLLFDRVGLSAELPDEVARISSRQKKEKYQYDADRADFLNSFVANDLALVGKAIEQGDVGRALATYLTPEDELDTTHRVDVRESVDTMYSTLSPANYPSGRWPAKDHYPLVFGQQFAINSMTRELDNAAGIFSVNGPPGTGKTTLLRDLVAHVVVERAKRLADLKHPEQAFQGVSSWMSDRYERKIALWKPEFSGFEIVVASSNNGAVENITLELPGADAIDDHWKESVDYFVDLAARAIGKDKPAWGLLAARLGNMGNRTAFVNRVWLDSKAIDAETNVTTEDTETLPGLKTWLNEITSRPSDWREAVKKFRDALAEEESLRLQRDHWSKQLSRLNLATAELEQLSHLANERTQASLNASNALRNVELRFSEANSRAEQIRTRKKDYLNAKPGLIERIVSFGRAYKTWRTRFLDLVHAEHDAFDIVDQVSRLVEKLSAVHDAAEKLEGEVAGQLASVSRRISQIESDIRDARAVLGEHFVESTDADSDDKKRELSSPWTDRAWNDARAKVFLEAMNLHKAFVVANSTIFARNLTAVVDVLFGSVPQTVPHEAVKSAWQTLFAIVPVVSSTFASYDRLFSNLKREDIGWLLIDEAGQGLPQAAVGALWRAKRAVIVGDPLQLEPILPLPFKSQQALRTRFGVSETWIPGRKSIQRLADRISKVGTYLKDHEGQPLWVSSPLRVHRRCDFQMFDVANKIAYNGMMVFGTVGRNDISLPETVWVNVTGGDADGHWIEDEGRVADAILSDIHDLAATTEPIYVISPFRDVTEGLRIKLGQRYKKVTIGTIHTVQGKESDVVLLVLGGNPEQTGAKKWASEKPNLLNVAVSRAKRRLYIVGNRDQWKSYNYFRQCADILPHLSTWPGLDETAGAQNAVIEA